MKASSNILVPINFGFIFLTTSVVHLSVIPTFPFSKRVKPIYIIDKLRLLETSWCLDLQIFTNFSN